VRDRYRQTDVNRERERKRNRDKNREIAKKIVSTPSHNEYFGIIISCELLA
jgi:hypothetical protein